MSDWTPDTDHIREIYSQDGHDTALINGQSENPHDKENQ